MKHCPDVPPPEQIRQNCALQAYCDTNFWGDERHAWHKRQSDDR